MWWGGGGTGGYRWKWYGSGGWIHELSDFEISVFPIKIRDVNKVYLISAWKIIDRTLRKVLALFSNKESRK